LEQGGLTMRAKTRLLLTTTAIEGDSVHDWGEQP
jgi:hypothetical protein